MCRAVYSTSESHSRPSSRGSRDHGGTSSGGTPSDASTHTLMQAATAVLDQHHSFTEPELIAYLADCYPEVPEELRRPLVLGAVAGAQRAAHMYVIVEKNKTSPDEKKRGMAANSACALSFWNMGLWTPSRTPSSSRRSSVSEISHATASLSTAETQPVLSVNLADLQLPVSLEQSHRDLEQTQQSTLCESSSYEVIAAAPPDAPLFVSLDALTASGTSVHVEPYIPPVLPGSAYVDMPYVPSRATQPPPQAGADSDIDTEPELLIDAPADPALFESQTEMETEKEEEDSKTREVIEAKKKETPEAKKMEGELKKKEELLTKKKEEFLKKKEAILKKTEEKSRKKEALEPKKREEEAKKSEEKKRQREEVRDPAAKSKVGKGRVDANLPGPPTERRRTSPRRASPRSTSRDELPSHTVSGWEWREFLNYCRRAAASRPPFKKYREDY